MIVFWVWYFEVVCGMFFCVVVFLMIDYYVWMVVEVCEIVDD